MNATVEVPFQFAKYKIGNYLLNALGASQADVDVAEQVLGAVFMTLGAGVSRSAWCGKN